MKTITAEQTSNSRLHGNTPKPTVLNLMKCKCPRCRQGNMFRYPNPWNLKKTMAMNTECAVCKQPFNIEVGFYFGSSYISYALTVALSIASFIAWWVFVGISVNDNRVLYWLPANAVLLLLLQPYLMRFARTGWLAFFIPYDKDWKTNPPKPPESVNKDQENNW